MGLWKTGLLFRARLKGGTASRARAFHREVRKGCAKVAKKAKSKLGHVEPR
jgi:hypothetical protein